MSNRLTEAQYKGLKIGDKVCRVAGEGDWRQVSACTIADRPSVSVYVVVDKIYYKGSAAPLNEGEKIIAGERELFLFALPCEVCEGKGKVRRGQEAQGFDFPCVRCNGDGLEMPKAE